MIIQGSNEPIIIELDDINDVPSGDISVLLRNEIHDLKKWGTDELRFDDYGRQIIASVLQEESAEWETGPCVIEAKWVDRLGNTILFSSRDQIIARSDRRTILSTLKKYNIDDAFLLVQQISDVSDDLTEDEKKEIRDAIGIDTYLVSGSFVIPSSGSMDITLDAGFRGCLATIPVNSSVNGFSLYGLTAQEQDPPEEYYAAMISCSSISLSQNAVTDPVTISNSAASAVTAVWIGTAGLTASGT